MSKFIFIVATITLTLNSMPICHRPHQCMMLHQHKTGEMVVNVDDNHGILQLLY